MKQAVRVLMLVAGLIGAMLSYNLGTAQALPTSANTGLSGPVFVFPSNGQTFKYGSTLVLQIQSVTGASGYLWSLTQDGSIVWQNLDAEGTLSSTTLTIISRGTIYSRLHPGNLQIRVRAELKDGQWTNASDLTVRLQGKVLPPQLQEPCAVKDDQFGGRIMYLAGPWAARGCREYQAQGFLSMPVTEAQGDMQWYHQDCSFDFPDRATIDPKTHRRLHYGPFVDIFMVFHSDQIDTGAHQLCTTFIDSLVRRHWPYGDRLTHKTHYT